VEYYNRVLGKKGEEEAEVFFRSQGFDIISRNFRFGKKGEIDLIAFKDGLLLFIEVKKRASSLYGGAVFSINRRKAATIRGTANYFLAQNPEFNLKEIICRFDLLAIEDNELVWHQDVIRW